MGGKLLNEPPSQLLSKLARTISPGLGSFCSQRTYTDTPVPERDVLGWACRQHSPIFVSNKLESASAFVNNSVLLHLSAFSVGF